ncbi:MAG: hypothetical protein ACR2QH_17765, partial [Geminicoccaceae bacterium]
MPVMVIVQLSQKIKSCRLKHSQHARGIYGRRGSIAGLLLQEPEWPWRESRCGIALAQPRQDLIG